MPTYYLAKTDLDRLLKEPGAASVLAPAETAGLTWLDALGDVSVADALSKPRSAQSPKGLLMPAAESVGRYGSAQQAAPVATDRRLVVGIRACELRALNYLDKVMLEGDVEDPAYRARRDKALLIACDCVDCTETCFCTMVGGKPYATEGFDVNLTPIEGGFLAEPGSERGQNWLLGEAGTTRLSEATEAQLARREEIRSAMVERVQEQNASFGFSADDETQPVLPNDGDEAWQRFAADCVECGACTNICPTCYCFYLYDQVLGPEAFERVRTWDSCLFSTYHRMAGGPNMKLTPRPRLLSRLANRVLHKFSYSPQQYGLLGCVGCGRCVDACIGAIDIRQVVRDLREPGK